MILFDIVNRLRTGKFGAGTLGFRTPAGARNFSFLQKVHVGYVAHPTFYSKDTGVSSLEEKAAGARG